MTLFGLIWIFVIIYCFKKNEIKYMLFVTLFFMTFQCDNVIYLNTVKGVGPQVLTSICFIIKFIFTSGLKLKKIKEDKSLIASISLSTIFFLIIVSGIINNCLFGKELLILQLAVYIVTFFLMKRAIYSVDKFELYRIIRTIIVFIVVVGIVQWLITGFIPSAKFLLKYIFFNDNDSENIYFNYVDKAHGKRIYSTFMEPSYFAVFAVGAFFYLLSFWSKIKENLILLLFLLTIILVSISSTAYGAFVITGGVFVVSSKELKIKWKIFLILSAVAFGIILVTMSYGVLDAVIFSKSTTSSGITRARWNREAYEGFLASPIIGVGYKNIRGSSIIVSLMGELGIIGLVSFLMFNFSSIWNVFFRFSKEYTVGYYGVLYAVISSFVCLIIACPDLDLCSYWFWLYLLSCYNGQELIKYKKKMIRIYKPFYKTTV